MAPSAQANHVSGLVDAALGTTNEPVRMGRHQAVAAKLARSRPDSPKKVSPFTSPVKWCLNEFLVVVDAVTLRSMWLWASLNSTGALWSGVAIAHPTLSAPLSPMSPIAGQLSAVNTAVMLANRVDLSRLFGAVLTALGTAITELAAIGATLGKATSHGISVPPPEDYTMPIAKGLLLRQGL